MSLTVQLNFSDHKKSLDDSKKRSYFVGTLQNVRQLFKPHNRKRSKSKNINFCLKLKMYDLKTAWQNSN
jgi:hypothetical protein